MKTVKERLDILRAGDVISEEASTLAEEAVQRQVGRLKMHFLKIK